MKKQTLGMMISTLRKEKGMTQLELAEKMGVNHWSRALNCRSVEYILRDVIGCNHQIQGGTSR